MAIRYHKGKRKKDKNGAFTPPKICIYIIYVLCFLTMFVFQAFSMNKNLIGLINDITADIIRRVAITVLFVTACCSVLKFRTLLGEKIFGVVVFSMAIILIWLMRLGSRYMPFIVFICDLAVAIPFIVYCIKGFATQHGFNTEMKTAGCLAFFFVLPMMDILTYDYVNDVIMLWALIPAGITLLIAAPLMLIFGKKLFITEKYPMVEKIAVVILIALAAFFVFWIGMSTVNTSFPSDCEIISCEVSDKRISSGSRTPTQFLLKTTIGDKEREIDVPAEIYHSTEIGETFDVAFYEGALGFNYYMYDYYSR